MRRPGIEAPEQVLVLGTLGAPERRRFRGRRGRDLTQAEPEPVPTSRATVIQAESFSSTGAAEEWLEGLRGAPLDADALVREALAVVNRALGAHRAAYADPGTRDVTGQESLATRVGYGAGGRVADGRFDAAWELPRAGGGARRSMESAEERFAALLGGRDRALACEELVLRARSDLDAGRDREAALQVRIALEALLAEVPTLSAARREPLERARPAIGAVANVALSSDLDQEAVDTVTATTADLEGALVAYRLSAATT